MTDQTQRLRLSRFSIGVQNPFYGILLNSVDLVIDNDCPTAYTTGNTIGFNEEFTGKLTDDNITFVLAHEIRHITDLHIIRSKKAMEGRKDSMSTSEWNTEWRLRNEAQDYRINYDLVAAKIGVMPSMGLYDKKYTPSWTSEMIYEDLVKNPREPQKGGGMDDHSKWGDAEESDQLSEAETIQKIMNAVTGARNINKAKGKSGDDGIPNEAVLIVNSLLESQVNWREEVISKVSEYVKQDKSWSTFNRRYAYQNIYMPYYTKGETTKLCIAIDTSGSISQREADIAISECRACIEQLDDFELYILNFSHLVHDCRKFTPADEFDYELQGSGGTDLSCITDHLEKEGIDVDCLFVITDGETYNWPAEDYCEDTTFLMTTNVIAPFGNTIKMEI